MTKKILIACEESQAVTKAFRNLGYEAFSCDILPCSGGKPEWHIQDDIFNVCYDPCWHLIVAFPPCTHLASSGAWLWKQKRIDGLQQQALHFVAKITGIKVPYLAIENPIGIISTKWRKPDQIIQPWQFGHKTTKATCLWLKRLPLLKPTNIVDGPYKTILDYSPKVNRSYLRSKTFEGVAKAMAYQWGFLCD